MKWAKRRSKRNIQIDLEVLIERIYYIAYNKKKEKKSIEKKTNKKGIGRQKYKRREEKQWMMNGSK